MKKDTDFSDKQNKSSIVILEGEKLVLLGRKNLI